MVDPPARIPRLRPEELSDDARGVFGALGPVRAGQDNGQDSGRPAAPGAAALANHVLQTFANHPPLAKSYLNFNGYLLSADLTLPVRLRQIAIQRVAWNRHCPYMWSSHLRVSLPVGLTAEDFDAVAAGPASPHWSAIERAVVRAADDLEGRSFMSDATWESLTAELSHQQVMDLIFVIGCYTALSMFMNAAQVEREPELVALAEQYGAPARPAGDQALENPPST
jgi:4-carboxymuconolactone decarboxylase